MRRHSHFTDVKKEAQEGESTYLKACKGYGTGGDKHLDHLALNPLIFPLQCYLQWKMRSLK